MLVELPTKPQFFGLAPEAVELALTPGIPREWVYAIFKMGHRKRLYLSKAMRGQPPNIANAESITMDDAHQMLLATPLNYCGAVPLYVQLYLKQVTEPMSKLAKRLNRSEGQLRNWRRKNIFDPLTGQRLIKSNGKQPT